jgi:hypothetical protein
MDPKPEDVAALQALFDKELELKRAERMRKSDDAAVKRWMIPGMLLGFGAKALCGFVLLPGSPLGFDTTLGGTLFYLGSAILLAGPVIGVVGAVRYMIADKGRSVAYLGAGISVGSAVQLLQSIT